MCIKIVTSEEAWLLHCCTELQLDVSSHSWIIVVWKLESQAHVHIHARIYKIVFHDVLDCSEYSDTNTSIFFYENIASSVRKQKYFYISVCLNMLQKIVIFHTSDSQLRKVTRSDYFLMTTCQLSLF